MSGGLALASRESSVRKTRFGRSWIVGWCIAAVIFIIGMTWNFAGLLNIERMPPVAAVVAPRNAVTLGALAVLVLIALLLAWPFARPVIVPLFLALLVIVATSGIIIVNRGVTNDQSVAASPGQIRVLSWNTNGDLVSPTVIARLAASEGADIVVLPDIPAPSEGASYAAAFAAAPLAMQPYPILVGNKDETVVFVSRSLGTYETQVKRGPNPVQSALLMPVTSGLPTIVALHAAHPAFKSDTSWNADIDWVENECSRPNVVAVGDFNGTVDSFGSTRLGACEDAATSVGAGSVGSWPTKVPTWAAMPLDHVLVSSGWKVDSFHVITTEDGSGARHRPVLAVLSPSH